MAPLTKEVSPLRDPKVTIGSKIYLVTRTVSFLFVWIITGISMACHGVALPDFLPRIGADYETISRSMSFGSLTNIIGCAIGMLSDRVVKWSDLFLSGGVFIAAVAFAILPWTRSLVTFSFVYCLFALGTSIVNTVTVYAVADMWKSASAFPLHFVHLGFGIGGFIAPLIAVPFLSPDSEVLHNMTTVNLTLSDNTKLNPSTAYTYNVTRFSRRTKGEFDSSIEILYSIVASLLVVSCCILVGFQIYGRPKDLSFESDNGQPHKRITTRGHMNEICGFLSPGNWAAGNVMFGTVILIGMMVFYTCLLGNDGTIRLFLFSFAIESELNITKQEAAFIDSAYNISFTVGRSVAGILSIFFPMQVLIFIELAGVVVAGFCLSFFLYTDIHFWVFICFFGVMIGSNWPAGLAWASKYVTLTATFYALVGFVNNLVMFGLYWLTGYLFDKAGPMTILYFCLSCSCLCLLTMTVLQIVARCGIGNTEAVQSDVSNEDLTFDVLKRTALHENDRMETAQLKPHDV